MAQSSRTSRTRLAKKKSYNGEVTTITWSENVENHVGMQQIGVKLKRGQGFTIDNLETIYSKLESLGLDAQLEYLNDPNNDEQEPAAILIIPNGVEALSNGTITADQLLAEQQGLTPDTQAWMRGRVVNKLARYNLCFADISQEADFENKKGTIVNFTDVPILQQLRESLPVLIGRKAENLYAEANYYYDVNKCGISMHGDSERLKVIGVRLGEVMALRFAWFHWSEKVSDYMTFDLRHGDVYIMSEKATGNDWKTRKIWTLRHAAGCDKYIEYVPPKKK